MQRIHNYGSTLQAYSLKRLIENAVPGATVSFVDYRPGDVLVGDATSSSTIGRLLAKLREYNSVTAPFKQRIKFFDHKRAYGKRYFSAAGIPAIENYDLDLDCQVIGSDEVFNCVQGNSKVGYSRDLFGYGTAARRLISYAASFGNTTLPKMRAAGIESQVKQDLALFNAISVRDRNSQTIVRELLGLEPPIHVDPALAYDLMADARVPPHRLHATPYIIVYGYSGRLSGEENRALRNYAQKIKARILTFGGVQECGDAFVECSPFELLAYFRDAACVVTDTFHGTIFSIINHRPFVSIVRGSAQGGYGNEEKLGYLLDSFDLSSRRLGDPDQLDQALASPLDDLAIESKLAIERLRTAQYLAEEAVVRTNQGTL